MIGRGRSHKPQAGVPPLARDGYAIVRCELAVFKSDALNTSKTVANIMRSVGADWGTDFGRSESASAALVRRAPPSFVHGWGATTSYSHSAELLLGIEPSGAAALEGALKFIGEPLLLNLFGNSCGWG